MNEEIIAVGCVYGMQLIERHWTACEVFCHPRALLSRSGGHNRRTWEQRRPWSSVPILRMMSGKPTVGSARLHLLCLPRDSDVKKGPSSRFALAYEHGQRNNLTFSSPGRDWSPPQTSCTCYTVSTVWPAWWHCYVPEAFSVTVALLPLSSSDSKWEVFFQREHQNIISLAHIRLLLLLFQQWYILFDQN